MNPGKTVRVALTAMAHGGHGLGRHEGKVIFVAGGIPGEEVVAQIIEDRGLYARDRLLEVITPSPHRIEEPRCPHFGTCGGCQWQQIAYEAQLAFKEEVVRDQLAHLGRQPKAVVKPTLGLADPWCTRNHVQLHVGPESRLGFMDLTGRRVVPLEVCPTMHPLLGEMFDALELAPPSLPEVGVKRVSLRAGVNTGERMVILETAGDEAPELEVEMPLSCVLLLQDGTPVSLAGSTYFHEVVGGRRFRISAGSFFQVNTAQAERLIETVLGYLDPREGDALLDAYCGVGTFGLLLAPRVGEVIGVEESPQALDDADQNAGTLDNVTLVEGRVEEVLPRLERVDLAILDPPRQGMAAPAVDALVGLGPRKIVYVSCDPATLARDVRRLAGAGYRLVEVQPLDMFPQTYHIESVALLVTAGGRLR